MREVATTQLPHLARKKNEISSTESPAWAEKKAVYTAVRITILDISGELKPSHVPGRSELYTRPVLFFQKGVYEHFRA